MLVVHASTLNKTYLFIYLFIYHIRLEIFSLPLSKLYSLENSLPIQINTAIVLDIQTYKSSCLSLSFANKVLEAITLSNIILNQSILNSSYFKNQFIPKIFYTYTASIATKI
jgi:hypothetical protein